VTLDSRYSVNWSKPLGEGAFGEVFVATDRKTGERFALKKIAKKYTDDTSFQREMNALMHIRKNGGHPHICSLREQFNEGDHYYLILDLVSGGEMFDHLVKLGAYSEADAARLVREVASALAFIHGIDCVHGDMKPENIMLSTENPSDSVVKLVDFGCAQVTAEDSAFKTSDNNKAAVTPAYCPPEVVDERLAKSTNDPSMDMWALGIILYIMLTGMHPFDLEGNASDDEIKTNVLKSKGPPLKNSPITAHLSPDAMEVIQKLLTKNPKKRMTAFQMLQHPWVRGETARRDKIADSDKKLSMYRVFKSGLEARVFEDIFNWSEENDSDISKRTSLIERSFRNLDPQHKGYITAKDLRKFSKLEGAIDEKEKGDDTPLTLSGFSDLLSDHMQNKYFPKGHILYRQGQKVSCVG
jgi:serine/threonine protein kinase